MSVPLIRRAIASLLPEQELPQRLAASYYALELIENTIQELAFLDPLDPPPRWAAAQEHAARARGALAEAHSIRWPLTTPPPTVAFAVNDIATVTDLLIELAEDLLTFLLEAAEQADRCDDEACCLRAALHGNDLTAALHSSRNARPTDAPS
ncbi:hypothetical protein [Actinomadura hibisca]|uniref:hypothetical protein n=1 Tax=Actinomadura hibisca TaxID=68565 RepID=UPI00083490D9|nr:hypothetical protein [Actinomadura hibisca]